MGADELRIMTSGAFTAAYLELKPRLERLTQKKLVTAATSIGTGEDSIPNRLRRGESVDIVIVADKVLVGFIEGGLIAADCLREACFDFSGVGGLEEKLHGCHWS